MTVSIEKNEALGFDHIWCAGGSRLPRQSQCRQAEKGDTRQPLEPPVLALQPS
jgi:hypothetical protein